ncbi:hypothetical protein [Serratia fonticola]|jgi:hypothetical protein|uniref:hypothetical protein n=1 Tax=Serratia fonticola TaxID=47917 RepID=UPI0014155A09|nr:hypothetical protein [Serratia fonticola]QIP93943.1 TniQ protein (modular protein) [Serratia fonticola]
MSILSYSGTDMLNDYYACCEESTFHNDIKEKWPPVCAQVRDQAMRDTCSFTLSRQHVSKISLGNWSFHWANAEAGEAMALRMGISDVGSIPVCDNRLAFLNEGMNKFSLLYENEMVFIADFISTLVWLIPKNENSNNGSASFYELPHVTFISDATLFFVPPYHRLPREYGFIGFVENLYHEALHHQVHTFNAFHGDQYCLGTIGESIIDFPQRQDRTFSYTQAFNACYVYGEIVKYRRKVAQYLSDEYRPEGTTWINEALDSAIMMRVNLAARLYSVKDAFLPPWKSLIEEWKSESETDKHFNSEKPL